ncbi:MAG: cupin domain-containing protein [Nocardioides sp.]
MSSATGHHVCRAAEGTAYDWSNDSVRILSAARCSEGALTLVEDTLKAGFVLPRHHHRRMTETFYCLDGEAVFLFDDEQVTIGVGDVVTVPPRVHHGVASSGGARLLTIFTPGGFDRYLAEVADLVARAADDPAALIEIGHRYDIWPDD